jgi:hypothetical protein
MRLRGKGAARPAGSPSRLALLEPAAFSDLCAEPMMLRRNQTETHMRPPTQEALHALCCTGRRGLSAFDIQTAIARFANETGSLCNGSASLSRLVEKLALILLERLLKHGESGAPRSWTSSCQA